MKESEVDKTLIRVMVQVKYVDMKHFVGTVNSTVAYKWKYWLTKCLETIKCQLHLWFNIAKLYLRGDAAVWWNAVRLMRHADMTYEEFLIAFNTKYFPREALHQKKNAFEHFRNMVRASGSMSMSLDNFACLLVIFLMRRT